MNVRNEFPMLDKNIIYFDNAATTFKPKCVIDEIVNYYTNYSSNSHRGDYDISIKTSEYVTKTRENIRKFINAEKMEEIIFTPGTTSGMNMIVQGYFKNKLNDNDEVILTTGEHASNILPWINLSKEKNIKIKYLNLDDNHSLTLDNLINEITKNTKVISIAHITNVIGDVRDIKKIIEYAHKLGILVVVDAAQSIAHIKCDVIDSDADFLVFSAHKMYGPTGIGILYGKYELLNKINPTIVGGGISISISKTGECIYKKLPYSLEAGTINIAGIFGLNKAIEFINEVGIDNISDYEINLKKYCISKMLELDNIEIYNKDTESGLIAFNVLNKDNSDMKYIFSQDVAVYLNSFNICIRSGDHCAKILQDELDSSNTCRISFSVYNTIEEIDILINALKDLTIEKTIIF